MTVNELLDEVMDSHEEVAYICVNINGVGVAEIAIGVNEENLKPWGEMPIQRAEWTGDTVTTCIE